VNSKGIEEGEILMNKRMLVLFTVCCTIFLYQNACAQDAIKTETRAPDSSITKDGVTKAESSPPVTIRNDLGLAMKFRCFDEENNEICVIDCDGGEKITLNECYNWEMEIPLSFDDKTLTMKKRLMYTDLKPGYDYLLMKSGRQQPDGSFNLVFIRDPYQVFED